MGKTTTHLEVLRSPSKLFFSERNNALETKIGAVEEKFKNLASFGKQIGLLARPEINANFFTPN